MDLKTNPLLSLSVRLWCKMGFIINCDWKKYIYLIPNSILNALQLSFLFFSGEENVPIILNAYFFVLYFNALVSGVQFTSLGTQCQCFKCSLVAGMDKNSPLSVNSLRSLVHVLVGDANQCQGIGKLQGVTEKGILKSLHIFLDFQGVEIYHDLLWVCFKETALSAIRQLTFCNPFLSEKCFSIPLAKRVLSFAWLGNL